MIKKKELPKQFLTVTLALTLLATFLSSSLYLGSGESSSFESSGDSYVNLYYPDNNYGSSSYLYTGFWGLYTWNTWLKFDLSSIPSNATILSATLNLKVLAVTPYPFPVTHFYFSSSDSWNESTITWNNQPSFNELLESKQLTGTGWYSWNITSSVLSEYSGDKIMSFGFNTTEVDSYVEFYSKENIDANRPYLTINYNINALGAWTPYYTPSTHLINRNVEPYLYLDTSTYGITMNSPTFEVANNGTYILSPMQGIIHGARTWNLANGTMLLWWEGGYNSVGPSPANGSSQQYYYANGLGSAYWIATDLVWTKDYGYKLVKYTNGDLYGNDLWKMTETIMALDNGYSWVQLIEIEFQSEISSYPNGSIAHTFVPMMGDQQNNNATFDIANNCFVIDSKDNPFRTYIGSNVSISNWALNSSWGTYSPTQSGLQGDYALDGCFSNTNTDSGNGTFAGFQFNYTNAYSGQKLVFPIIHTYTNKSLADGGLSLYDSIKENLQTELDSVKTNFYNFMDTSPVLYSSNQNLNDLWYWNLAKTYRITVKTGSGSLVLNSPFAYGDFFLTSTNLGFGSHVEELLANNQFDIATEILSAFLQNQFDNGHIPHDLNVNNSVSNLAYPSGLSELPDGLACWISAVSRYYLWSANQTYVTSIWSNISKAIDKLYLDLQQPENLVNESSAGNFWDTLKRNGFVLWTNAYTYDAFHMASLMAKKIGNTTCYNLWNANATNVHSGIQTYLWNSSLGYFNSFYNGTYFGGEYCAPGNMLAIIFNIATESQKTSILQKAWEVGALEAFPIRTITPSYPASMDTQNWQYRENGGIFPMVSGWWIHNEFQGNNASSALATLEQIYERTVLNLTGGYIVGSLEHYNQTTGEPTGANQAYGEVWEEVPMTQAILQGMIGVTIGENITLKPFVPSEILSLNLTKIALQGTPLDITFSLGGFVVDDANPVPIWDFYVDGERKAAGVTSFDLSIYLDGQPHEIVVVSLHPPNHPSENVDVEITDMEGCGNWVFSQTKFYTFQAKFWDGDGYTDLSSCSIAFTDGLNWINATYDLVAGVFRLDNGDNVTRLKSGTVTVIDANEIQVTFPIYFQNTILDADNVSLYMRCIDLSGASDGWELMESNYFNIYNLGGHSTLETVGNAGRIIGGDIFDLYAENSTRAEATITFRDLQHVKMSPTLKTAGNGAMFTFFIEYCVGDVWVRPFAITLISGITTSGSVVQWNWTAIYYELETEVKRENFYTYFQNINQTEYTQDAQLFIDLWFNRMDAGTTWGARVNAYYYPMVDNSNLWLRWVSSTWGVDERVPKQSECFGKLRDNDGNVMSVSNVKLVRVGCNITTGSVLFGPVIISKIEHFVVFDLTFGSDPLQGVQTPPWDETKIPTMAQGGLLGSIWTGLAWFAVQIVSGITWAAMTMFDVWVDFCDTVFTAMGFPNVADTYRQWLTSSISFLIDALGYSFQLLTMFFSFLTEYFGKIYTILNMAFTIWMSMLTYFTAFLGGTYTSGVNIWVDYNIPQWITLVLILYPIYLVFLWDEKGLGAVLDQLTFLYNVLHGTVYLLLTIAEYIWGGIARLIEAIPVVE